MPSFAIAISLIVLSSAIAKLVVIVLDEERLRKLYFKDNIILKDKLITKLKHVA
jgi:hypothetical protein